MDLIPLSSVIVPQRRCTVDLNLSETKLLQDSFKTGKTSRKRIENSPAACHENKRKRTYEKKSKSNTKNATDGESPFDIACKEDMILNNNTAILKESPTEEKRSPTVENDAENLLIYEKNLQSTSNRASNTNLKLRNSELDMAKSFDSGVDTSCSESTSCGNLSPPLSANSVSGVLPLAVSSPKDGEEESDDLRKSCVPVLRCKRNDTLNCDPVVPEGSLLTISNASKPSSLFDSSRCKLPFEYAVSMAENLRPRKTLFLEQDEASDEVTSIASTKYHLWEVRGVSSIVFGKPKGCDWWPGVIVDHRDIKQRPALDSCCWIRWFGDDSISEALAEQLCPFATFPEKYVNKLKKGKYRKAIKEALEIVARQLGAENLLNGKDDYKKIQSLVDWAMETFGETGQSCGVNEGCRVVSNSSRSILASKFGDESSSAGNEEEGEAIELYENVEASTKQPKNFELSPQQDAQPNHHHEPRMVQEETSETNVLNTLDSQNQQNSAIPLSVFDVSSFDDKRCSTSSEENKEDKGNLKLTSVKHVHALGNGGQGSLVFGKLKGFDWWPAMIISEKEARQREPLPRYCWIKWFGDAKISELRTNQVESLSKFPMYFLPGKMRGLYKKAVNEALMDAAKRCNMIELTVLEDSEERLAALIAWGKSGFPSKHLESSSMEQFIIEDKSCSEEQRVRANEVFHASETCQETDNNNHSLKPSIGKHVKTSKTRFGNVLDKPTLSSNVKRLFDEVYEGKRNIEEICLACGDTDVTSPHPLFEGGFCTECHGLFLETAYLLDEDGYQMYCTICNDGTEVIMCDEQGCFRSYCSVCIDMFCGVGTTEEIQRRETWICFLCSGEKVRLLKSRKDWQGRMKDLFSTEDQDEFPPLQLFPPVPVSERKPLRVLALFDGIASGLLALRELGIDVEYYAASEIDEQAIAVSHVKHNGIIHQLGDVRHITEKDIAKLGPFDLVLGGSPCNDLSIANPLRKGIYEGTGRLFFEFFRLLMYARPMDENSRPFFWLFENVVGMRHEDRKTISRFLQCNPCMVDAKEVSPMHRARYFWGNLPGMSRGIHPHPGDRLLLRECLEPNSGREARFEKVRTITTRGNSLKQTKEMLLPVTMKIGSKTQEDGLWCTEIERLFGFPDHYTDVACMGRTHRQKLLGSAWCIPVIRHLLSPLRDYFKTVEKNKATDD